MSRGSGPCPRNMLPLGSPHIDPENKNSLWQAHLPRGIACAPNPCISGQAGGTHKSRPPKSQPRYRKTRNFSCPLARGRRRGYPWSTLLSRGCSSRSTSHSVPQSTGPCSLGSPGPHQSLECQLKRGFGCLTDIDLEVRIGSSCH